MRRIISGGISVRVILCPCGGGLIEDIGHEPRGMRGGVTGANKGGVCEWTKSSVNSCDFYFYIYAANFPREMSTTYFGETNFIVAATHIVRDIRIAISFLPPGVKLLRARRHPPSCSSREKIKKRNPPVKSGP